MTEAASASRSALGGSNDEKGSEFRARVGALLATAIITGSRLSDLDRDEAPIRPRPIAAEADSWVDDLKVTCEDDSKVLFQAKLTAGTGLRVRLFWSEAESPELRAIRGAEGAVAPRFDRSGAAAES